MFEQLQNKGSEKPNEESFEFFFTRHGVALYREHARVLESESPEKKMNNKIALNPDLNPEKLDQVREAAEVFFSRLNPKTDILVFASSDLPRALETANIYREVAHKKGFEVVHHGKQARNEYANTLAGDEVRVIDSLSVKVENLVTLNIFQTVIDQKSINWEAVNGETKKHWDEARAIIESDNRANWGENFIAHVDEVGKFYPDLLRAKAAYQRQFENLMRLARFVRSKKDSISPDKNIKILTFGHENQIRPFLLEHFGDPEIDNVETISMSINDGSIALTRRGITKKADL